MRLAYAWFALACVAFVVVALGCLALAFYRTGTSWDHASGVFGVIAMIGLTATALTLTALFIEHLP